MQEYNRYHPLPPLHRRHYHTVNSSSITTTTTTNNDAITEPQERWAVTPMAGACIIARQASREEMESIFQLCRSNQWKAIYERIKSNPWISITPMVMDNHISTTIVHQAITSKGDIKMRAKLISTILKNTPEAACIKNGYGSLPLHVISQRNTKMDAITKEKLIYELVHAYKGALVEEGGVGKRTPLHIIFTDYISPQLTQMMIDNGQKACFMKDKKGYLPIHVACSRHCSPEKLGMLLQVNPQSLFAKTKDGQTPLMLATSTATKSHPNYALIDELSVMITRSNNMQAMSNLGAVHVSSEDSDADHQHRRHLDSNDSWRNGKPTRKRMEDEMAPVIVTPPMEDVRRSRKRKRPDEESAGLLLHFSRHNSSPRTSLEDSYAGHFAQV